MWLVGDEIN